MDEGLVIVKPTEVPVPVDGTFPEPVHPVHTYCTPLEPADGEVTDSVMTEPEANQPLAGEGESCAEDTVR
jgi:hypothetical protein